MRRRRFGQGYVLAMRRSLRRLAALAADTTDGSAIIAEVPELTQGGRKCIHYEGVRLVG